MPRTLDERIDSFRRRGVHRERFARKIANGLDAEMVDVVVEIVDRINEDGIRDSAAFMRELLSEESTDGCVGAILSMFMLGAMASVDAYESSRLASEQAGPEARG